MSSTAATPPAPPSTASATTTGTSSTTSPSTLQQASSSSQQDTPAPASTATSVSGAQQLLIPPPHAAPPAAGQARSNPASSTLTNTLPSHAASTERQVAEARTAIVASIGNMLDRELQGRAAMLHSNAAAIEKQQRDVARATEGLRRENEKLGKLAVDAARKVKEIGNVQNWAEVLERDFLVLEETLRLVRRGSWSGSGSGSGSEGSWSGTGSVEGSVVGDGEGDVVEHEAGQVSGEGGLERSEAAEEVPRNVDEDVSMEETPPAAAIDKGKGRDDGPPDPMEIDVPKDTPAPFDPPETHHTATKSDKIVEASQETSLAADEK